jgi:3-dehydroquinate synthase
MTKRPAPVNIRVALAGGRAYTVSIGRGLDLGLRATAKTRVVFCHDGRLKPPRVPARTRIVKLPAGEMAKTFSTWKQILDVLVEEDQGSPLLLVAYGGGAVGDVVGFAAASYRRGIPFLQVPTTLLAMVDASVGGKTAINHPNAKNMIGAFHQPVAVIADLDRLATLPAREFRAGLAEVVKHGLIGDIRLFHALESRPADFASSDRSGVRLAVERSVRLKADVVRRDERETRGVREILNLGHTLGHAIESLHRYKGIRHGEAVAIGTCAACRVSRDLLGFSETARVESVISALGLPTRLHGESAAKLLAATRFDKKRRSGRLRMTLLKAIGKPEVVDGIDERVLGAAARAIGAGR